MTQWIVLCAAFFSTLCERLYISKAYAVCISFTHSHQQKFSNFSCSFFIHRNVLSGSLSLCFRLAVGVDLTLVFMWKIHPKSCFLCSVTLRELTEGRQLVIRCRTRDFFFFCKKITTTKKSLWYCSCYSCESGTNSRLHLLYTFLSWITSNSIWAD